VGQSEPAVKALPTLEADRICAVLRRALQRLCPPELLPEREDLVQAALLKLLEVRQRAEQAAPLPASYLWQVAYTTAMDELRKRRRRQNVQEPALVEPSESPEPRPDLRAAIAGCLQGLPEDRRAAVTLHLHGFSAEQAARSLGFVLKRVQNLTYRGLADLRKCLRAKGAVP
jgi:RNA polymerase sigma-70 factor (ECF subfamily)